MLRARPITGDRASAIVTSLEDAQIIALLKARKPDGLETLLRRIGPGVKAWLAKTCSYHRDEHLLEEAIHDAALTLWRVAERLDANQNLSAYFYTVARRELLRLIKARSENETTDHELVAQLPDDHRKDDDRNAGESPFSARVRAYLETLSPLEQAVLGADFASDFKVTGAELAKQLGSSPQTIFSIRNRTKRKLEQFVQPKSPEGTDSSQRGDVPTADRAKKGQPKRDGDPLAN